MIYFPDVDYADLINDSIKFELPLNFKAKRTGNYTIEVFKDGNMVSKQKMRLKAQESNSIILANATSSDIFFISIK